jgi:hypothetical protein
MKVLLSVVAAVIAMACSSPGAFAAESFAVVDSTGVLVRGDEAASVGHPSTGNYIVLFTRNIRHCAYVATVGAPDNAKPPLGIAAVASEAANANAVHVRTWGVEGTLRDRPFHLAVICRGP